MRARTSAGTPAFLAASATLAARSLAAFRSRRLCSLRLARSSHLRHSAFQSVRWRGSGSACCGAYATAVSGSACCGFCPAFSAMFGSFPPHAGRLCPMRGVAVAHAGLM